jgi:hypothetical protein
MHVYPSPGIVNVSDPAVGPGANRAAAAGYALIASPRRRTAPDRRVAASCCAIPTRSAARAPAGCGCRVRGGSRGVRRGGGRDVGTASVGGWPRWVIGRRPACGRSMRCAARDRSVGCSTRISGRFDGRGRLGSRSRGLFVFCAGMAGESQSQAENSCCGNTPHCARKNRHIRRVLIPFRISRSTPEARMLYSTSPTFRSVKVTFMSL